MRQILEITNLIVNYKVDLSSLLLIILFSMPYFLEFVIPMSIMMSVLLTFTKMSSNNEITTLKSSGCSIYKLLPPVILFCFFGFLFTGFVSIYCMSWSKSVIKKLTSEIVLSNANMGIKEREFINNFTNVVLYINKINPVDKTLVDIFIEDQRTKGVVSTVIAPKGRLFSQPDKLFFHLQLYKGTINQVNLKNKTTHSISFNTYDITLDLNNIINNSIGKQKSNKEMSVSELYLSIKNTSRNSSEYFAKLLILHKKFSIPFACFALGIIAVSLGIQVKSAKKSYGIGVGLIFFLFYYIILSFGQVFGETGSYPPVIGMWLPNIITGGLGLFLLYRSSKDYPIGSFSIFKLLKKKH
jgi:lipopolysaccharide export system permease protein